MSNDNFPDYNTAVELKKEIYYVKEKSEHFPLIGTTVKWSWSGFAADKNKFFTAKVLMYEMSTGIGFMRYVIDANEASDNWGRQFTILTEIDGIKLCCMAPSDLIEVVDK